jgi:hypothetical protein
LAGILPSLGARHGLITKAEGYSGATGNTAWFNAAVAATQSEPEIFTEIISSKRRKNQ